MRRWEIFYTFTENFYNMKDFLKHIYEQDYYKSDPLFEYIKEVTDEFWPESYPSEFAKRLISNKITNFKLDEYLIAATEEQHFKHTSFSKLYNNEIDATSPKREESYSGEIAATLKAYGLDFSKFWYLCLMIKDCVEGATKKGCIIGTTHRSIINKLISHFDQLKPNDYPYPSLKSSDVEIELCLNIKKKRVKKAQNIPLTNNSYTLLVIQEALKSFLNSNKKKTFKLDSPAVNLKRIETLKKDRSQPEKVSLFYRYLKWFLDKRVIDEEFVNNSKYSVSTSKSLLITRMAYFVGLTDNENFLRKDGLYARTYISGYENVEVDTLNLYYDTSDEFKYLIEVVQKL